MRGVRKCGMSEMSACLRMHVDVFGFEPWQETGYQTRKTNTEQWTQREKVSFVDVQQRWLGSHSKREGQMIVSN
jgi:hypothetical protein